VNLYCRHQTFALEVERAILADCKAGERAARTVPYRRAYAAVELALSHYHGGRGSSVRSAQKPVWTRDLTGDEPG
jgi:hypothetical protein